MGAYVKLLEYDNIDGMILLSELSRRRIRSIQKLIRVGRNEVVVVLRVDKEKGMSSTESKLEKPGQLIRNRLYRSLEAPSISRGYRQVRGAVQQEQDGPFDYAPCGREDPNPYRGTLRDHNLAAEQEIWPCD